MIRLLWTLSSVTRYYLRRYTPSNRVLDAIRTRRGLKWGLPAMLIAVPYLLVANLCTALIADGGPGWLHLVVIVCIWNSSKFLIMGPVSVVLLMSVRIKEAVERRQARTADEADQVIDSPMVEAV